MNTQEIIDKLENSDRLRERVRAFCQKGATLFHGGNITQQVLLLALAMRAGVKHVVVTVPDVASLRRWQQDIAFFMPSTAVGLFPRVETTSFQVTAQSMENESERMRSLALLNGTAPAIVLATMAETAAKIPSPEILRDRVMSLCVGDIQEREQIWQRWVQMGYERVPQVERRGHFAVRGDVVDIFSPQMEEPLRLNFFDAEIECMYRFDLATQRTFSEVAAADIYPARMPVGDAHLPAYTQDGVWVVEEVTRSAEVLRQLPKENPTLYAHLAQWPAVWESQRATAQVFFSLISQRVPQVALRERIPLDGHGVTNFRKQWPLLVQEVRKWIRRGRAVILVVSDEGKKNTIQAVLADARVGVADTVAAGCVTIFVGRIEAGFEWPYEGMVLLAEGDLFGVQKMRRQARKKNGNEIRYFSDLNAGDYVVHRIHGIGRYTGVETIVNNGIHRDYLCIEYAGVDKLFLPTEKIGDLEKYIAPDGTVPTLHKMGGAQWERAKAKARRSIDGLADKLVALYAERETVTGYAFPPDTPWQQEFEEAFPFEETPDQLQAVAEIKASMEKPQPMDRLLCGDVGFGKTEVAMRAAFKAVMSGKQVVVLTPTTVLSQQHYRTFTERMGSFGVQIGVLNRFRTPAERRETIAKVRQGQIDILIGTHALFNKRIVFADLGLLIVDEEQRFGVAQKERWKERKTTVDVLTLSATPIPRTLHMSLAGVRELSVIYTPPSDRLPVQTYVTEASDDTIRRAIMQEYERGGQIYFVYNRIDSIERMTAHLQELVPAEVTFDIAHGGMSGEQLERVMQDFYAGYFDVLVCTSLVENGLDQPNANTILIYDADRLGLSQLYQMRGRVGRSARNAFAYFLYRPERLLNEAAEKRLYAIRELTELGSGFKIALRDLEIRGAGNLLGAEQHGNMVGVGFTAYCSMLDEAVARKRGETPRIETMHIPVLELQVEAYLPDSYIADETQKLEMYRRLAETVTMAELADIRTELEERFGKIPLPTSKLLEVVSLRVMAMKAGIGSIRELNQSVEIHWVKPEAMEHWDIAAVPDNIMKSIQFLPSDLPRAKINKIKWNAPAIDFLPEVLAAFLIKSNTEE